MIRINLRGRVQPLHSCNIFSISSISSDQSVQFPSPDELVAAHWFQGPSPGVSLSHQGSLPIRPLDTLTILVADRANDRQLCRTHPSQYIGNQQP
jgi:hypothetical protein